MADALVSTAAMGLDQAVYDLATYPALRAELYFDAIADVKPAPGNQAGSSTIFRKIGALAVATTPLSETVDVDAVTLSDSTVTLTLAEYGNAAIATELARNTSYVPLDPILANEIGANAGETMDTLAATALAAATNVIWATGGATTPTSNATVDADDTITAHDVRQAVANLRTAKVATREGAYWGFIHPDVSLDLREETGGAAWVDPANYSDATRRWNGEIGKFEGVRFIETPRAPMTANAGAGSTVDVYSTFIVGSQALAKTWAPAVGPRPRIGFTPVTDHLERFRGVYWYWTGGHGLFRNESVRVIKSASSIGANT